LGVQSIECRFDDSQHDSARNTSRDESHNTKASKPKTARIVASPMIVLHIVATRHLFKTSKLVKLVPPSRIELLTPFGTRQSHDALSIPAAPGKVFSVPLPP
jgi:hypothetical protein